MTSSTVTAVVVAHSSAIRLSEVLDALRSQTHPVSIRVASVGAVRGLDDIHDVTVFPVAPEAGFAEAVNVASAGVASDFLLICHDDAAPDPDAVERMVARAEAEADVAAVGAKLVEWDNPNVLQEIGSSIDRFAVRRVGLENDEVDHGQHDSADDVLFCSAAFLLVRTADWMSAGRFDPDAWPLYEDVDLCWQLRRSGHRVVVAPLARVRHAAALSRGMRRTAGPSFGAAGIQTHIERGRLRFMLKHYTIASIALIIPQYFVLSISSVIAGLVRREFWRVRTFVSAWGRTLAELPKTLERRRQTGPHRVGDLELLRLASRSALLARRAQRIGTFGRFMETFFRWERRALDKARDPVTWAAIGAAAVVAVVLRQVLFGGTFTLGGFRPFAAVSEAARHYRTAGEGLDPAGPAQAGIMVLAFVRSLVRSAALAQKVMLIAPLLIAAFGALRLAKVMGLGDTGRRWLALLAAVNPATLVLLRGGQVSALILWAATPWIASSFLSPAVVGGDAKETWRRRSRWALVWGAVVALSPSSLIWFIALAAVLAFARSDDGQLNARLRLLGFGVAGAFVLGLPGSLEWFGPHSPLVGFGSGVLSAARVGLAAATFGAGWPMLAWLVVALTATLIAGPTRTTVSLTLLLALAWGAGAVRLFADPAALATSGWSVILLLAMVGRRVRDQLPRYEVGWRQILIAVSLAVVGIGWVGGAVRAVITGPRPALLRIVPGQENATGRVLWIQSSGADSVTWVTNGFSQQMRAFPPVSGPEHQLLTDALSDARGGRTHRLGAVLALANISDVVVYSGQNLDLAGQADLSVTERQAGAVVYRNGAWTGPVIALAGPPTGLSSPSGLARLVRSPVEVKSSSRPDGSIRYRLPKPAPSGVVYVAGGRRSGWKIGSLSATPAAAGVYVDASAVDAAGTASAPGGWKFSLIWVAAAALLALAAVYLATLYLAGTEGGPAPVRALELHSASLRLGLPLLPIVLVLGAVWLTWTHPTTAIATGQLSSAWYCPAGGDGYEQNIAIVNPSFVTTRFAVRPSLTQPAIRDAALGGRERITVKVDPIKGAVVESFGGGIVVASTIKPANGSMGSTPCQQHLPRTNFFPEGGRAATGAKERLHDDYVIHNPFPEPARAAVRFYPADEHGVSPPALQDIRIPAGKTVVINHESQLEPQNTLSTSIRVWQGRAVVSRRLTTEVETFWTTSVDLRTAGAFAHVSTRSTKATIVALNPSPRRATVKVLLVGNEGSLPGGKFEVEAGSRAVFDIGSLAPDIDDMLVRLDSNVPMAFEAVVVPPDRTMLSILPLQKPASRWVFASAEDRAIYVTNPETKSVRLTYTVLGGGGSLEPWTLKPGKTKIADLLNRSGKTGLIIDVDGGQVVASGLGKPGSSPGWSP